MNHIYRSLYNKALGAWVAVPEIAKTHGKSASGKSTTVIADSKRFVCTALASAVLLASGQVMAAVGDKYPVPNGNGDNYCYYDTTSQSVVCGDANAQTDDTFGTKQAKSVVVGLGAKNVGESNVAVGAQSESGETASVAIGAAAKALHNQSVAIGQNAEAHADWDISIGRFAGQNIQNPEAEGRNIAIGDGALKAAINPNNTTAIGTSAGAGSTGDFNVLIGTYANSTTVQPGGVTASRVVAIGERALATRDSAISIGNRAKANGSITVAIGANADAKGNYSIANGYAATAEGVSSIAIGAAQNLNNKTQATKHYAIALGSIGTQATAEAAIAIGKTATAASQNAVVIGSSARVKAAEVNGGKVRDRKGNELDVRNVGTTTGNGSVAVGMNSTAFGTNATAVGQTSEALGQNSFAGGQDSHATGKSAVAIGDGATSSHDSTTSVGPYSKATAAGSSAYGFEANASGDHSLALGSKAKAEATQSTAIGGEARATVNHGVALGSLSVADVSNGQVGADPLEAADAKNNSTWTATHAAISVGNGTTVTRQITSVAAGKKDTDAVNVAQLKAAGFKLTTSASTGDVDGTTLEKVQNGETVTIDAGENIKVTQANNKITVATKQNVTFTSVKTGDSVLNSDGLTINTGDPANPLGITKAGISAGGNRITNVAPSQNGTDAVNKDELNAAILAAGTINQTLISNNTPFSYVNDKGEQLIREVNPGTGAVTFKKAATPNEVYNGTDITIAALNPTSASQAVSPTRVGNVADGVKDHDAVNVSQLNALKKHVDTGWEVGNGMAQPVGAVKPGSKVDFVAGNAHTKVEVTKDPTGANNFKVAVSAAPSPLQYTTTNNSSNSNDPSTDPFTPTAQVTLVGPNGNTSSGVTINNVAPAVLDGTSKQAVNGSQLFAVGDSTAKALGGTSTFNPQTGVVTAGLNVDGTTHNNVQDALNAIQTTANQATKSLIFAGDTGTDVSRKLGETVNIVGGETETDKLSDNNIGVVANGAETLEVKLAKDLKDLGSAEFVDPQTGNSTKIDGNGVTIAGGPSITKNGIDAGNNKIINVAKGENDHDAVNVKQLKDEIARNPGTIINNTYVVDNTTVSAGKGIKVTQNGDDYNVALADNITISSLNAGPVTVNENGLTINNNTYVDANGLNANGQVIRNVAAGRVAPDSMEAVNGAQLHALGNQLGDVDKRARAGIASAMASAGLPQAYRPGANMVAASAGHYDGQTAIAIGASTISDNGRWILKGTLNVNSKDAGATVGIGYQW